LDFPAILSAMVQPTLGKSPFFGVHRASSGFPQACADGDRQAECSARPAMNWRMRSPLVCGALALIFGAWYTVDFVSRYPSGRCALRSPQKSSSTFYFHFVVPLSQPFRTVPPAAGPELSCPLSLPKSPSSNNRSIFLASPLGVQWLRFDIRQWPGLFSLMPFLFISLSDI
jgi:hypothetical protein